MAKKKRSFHCQKCGEECTIYKKGKGHRVLVCPSCGVLATNPIRATGFLGKVYRTAASVPVLGSVATGLEEFGIVEPNPQKSSPKASPMSCGVSGRTPIHRLNALDWAERALSAR